MKILSAIRAAASIALTNFMPALATVLACACLVFEDAHAVGWFSAGIDDIELTSTGEIIVFLESAVNHECGTKRVDYVNPADAHAKSFLAALLAWQAQSKPIRVYISSCDGTTGIFSAVLDDD